MRLLPWALCISIAGTALLAKPPPRVEATLIFTGDIRGYLAPCGCTQPQVGGIERMAGVVRALLKQRNAHYVDLGNWTEVGGRQDELKAEALAEVFAGLKPAYLNVGPLDARLGPEYLRSLSDAVGGVVDSANLNLGGATPGRRGRAVGDSIWVQGLVADRDAERIGSPLRSVAEAVSPPPSTRRQVLLFAADLKEADALAREFPHVSLIVYSTRGDPPASPVRVGKTALVSVGDKARYVGKIDLVDGEWTNFTLIELGPEHAHDPAAAEAYRAYTNRVAEEGLLDDLLRSKGKVKFVGSRECAVCHIGEDSKWLETRHAKALATLVQTGNDRDPECVGCHVVGLNYESGFRGAPSTPELANVGCESCHGPGGEHVFDPTVKMGVAGEESCMTCHETAHSPEFDFKSYWEKIKH